jgi:hypothetical protein
MYKLLRFQNVGILKMYAAVDEAELFASFLHLFSFMIESNSLDYSCSLEVNGR